MSAVILPPGTMQVGDHIELACGCFVCPAIRVRQVLQSMPRTWKKRSPRSITSFTDKKCAGFKAIHLTPTAARTVIFRSSKETSKIVDSILAIKGTVFHAGVRVGECEGLDSGWYLSAAEKKLQASFSNTNGSPSARKRKKTNFTFAELFAGIGGFRLGLEQLGGTCIFASEIDREARSIYAQNFRSMPWGDITEIPSTAFPAKGTLDILTAGFPCQSFSRNGHGKGFFDPRGSLFFEVIRFLHTSLPKYFILENVPELLTIDDGKMLKSIVKMLKDAGYSVHYRVLNSRPLVAQRRQRLYIVGFRAITGAQKGDNGTGQRRVYPNWLEGDFFGHTPLGGHSDNLAASTLASSFQWPTWSVDGDRDVNEQNDKELKKRIGPCASLPTEAKFKWPIVEDILEQSVQWEEHALTTHQFNKVRAGMDYVSSPHRRIVSLKSAARTLVSSYKSGFLCNGEFILPEGSIVPDPLDGDGEDKFVSVGEKLPRFFTPRECARLQGFPEIFKINGCPNPNRFYHMIGNSVCPLVVTDIAKCMLGR